MADRETRLRRARVRATRRGMKETDLIFEAFCNTRLDDLADSELDAFEALLEEADQDIYAWVVAPDTAPSKYQKLARALGSCAIR